MSKQIQDAYIVAATRTPISKSGQGLFKNTRPTIWLVAAVARAPEQVPTLDPKAIEDATWLLVPGRGAGTNMARVVAGGREHGRRRHRQPLLRWPDRAADGSRPIRVGEADVMIASGAESSMVPMGGNKPSFKAGDHLRRDEKTSASRTALGLTAPKVAAQWKVTREAQDAFALDSRQKALATRRPASSPTMTPDESSTAPNPGHGGEHQDAHRQPRRRRAPTPRWKGLSPSLPVFAANPGSVTCRQQLADERRRRCADPSPARRPHVVRLKPLAVSSSRGGGVPPEIMGIGSIEAIPGAARAADARPGLDRAERGLCRAMRWR